MSVIWHINMKAVGPDQTGNEMDMPDGENMMKISSQIINDCKETP